MRVCLKKNERMHGRIKNMKNGYVQSNFQMNHAIQERKKKKEKIDNNYNLKRQENRGGGERIQIPTIRFDLMVCLILNLGSRRKGRKQRNFIKEIYQDGF